MEVEEPDSKDYKGFVSVQREVVVRRLNNKLLKVLTFNSIKGKSYSYYIEQMTYEKPLSNILLIQMRKLFNNFFS